MGRGVWIGIGVVIGIIVALVLVSVLPWISPGTAATMHLLKISTVTMPVYAGTRTVTTTATTTVTKYLGGKVLTITSTATRTVTTTVTATPHLLTTRFMGTTVPLYGDVNGTEFGAGYIKVHNHTLYVLIKPVYRTVTVGRVVKVPGTGVLLEDMNKIRVGTVLSNAREIIIVGVPVPPSWFSASHAIKRIAIISVSSMKIVFGYDLAMFATQQHLPPAMLRSIAYKFLRETVSEIRGLESEGFHVVICKDAEPFHTVMAFPVLVYTDKYVIGGIPTRWGIMPIFLANKTQFIAYLESHGAKPYACIEKTTLSYLVTQLRELINDFLAMGGAS